MKVTIAFSRHALRRMQLYGIEEDDVAKTIKSALSDKQSLETSREVINRGLAEKYRYPLKVIFVREVIE